MPPKKKPVPEDSLGPGRMVFFSHALTEVPRQLASIGPSFMMFFISFVVIGIYWISHHRYFSDVSSTAVILVWWLSPLAVLAAIRIFGKAQKIQK